jgi:hypothetical protein
VLVGPSWDRKTQKDQDSKPRGPCSEDHRERTEVGIASNRMDLQESGHTTAHGGPEQHLSQAHLLALLTSSTLISIPSRSSSNCPSEFDVRTHETTAVAVVAVSYGY